MRIEKRGAACRELVDVWCLGHRVSTEVANPVVLVIDGDEENVRSLCGKSGSNEQAGDEECADLFHSAGR